jgi:GNAT superfamily N-acetyltransferase
LIVRSLALTTELALAATRGTIIDRGDYVVIETPDDPGYAYGNLLVLPAPPQVGEVAYWTRKFEAELGKPGITHVTFWWDGATGDLGAERELIAANFALELNLVMTATQVTASPSPLPIRELVPGELELTHDLAWALGDRHDENYREFLRRRAHWQRSLVERGLAKFFGAFDGSELVASLGLVAMKHVARYQDVQTSPNFRKRGLAGALLATAAAALPAERYVIMAAPGGEAERVYRRVGFALTERTASACRYPLAPQTGPVRSGPADRRELARGVRGSVDDLRDDHREQERARDRCDE